MLVKLDLDGQKCDKKSLFTEVASGIGVVISTYDDWDVFVSDFCDFFYDYPDNSLLITIANSEKMSDIMAEFVDCIGPIAEFPLFEGRISLELN